MPLYQSLVEDGTGAGRRLPSQDQGSSEESLYVLYYHVSAFSPVIILSVDSSPTQSGDSCISHSADLGITLPAFVVMAMSADSGNAQSADPVENGQFRQLCVP